MSMLETAYEVLSNLDETEKIAAGCCKTCGAPMKGKGKPAPFQKKAEALWEKMAQDRFLGNTKALLKDPNSTSATNPADIAQAAEKARKMEIGISPSGRKTETSAGKPLSPIQQQWAKKDQEVLNSAPKGSQVYNDTKKKNDANMGG